MNKPRYAHGARIMNAYRSDAVSVWGAAELDLADADLAPLTVFHAQSFPPPAEVGEILQGNAEDVADDLVMILRTQRLIS
jgi:electron transfer flavoprotein alpha/beta subunit